MQLGDEFIMGRVGVNKWESELSEWLRNKACLQQPVKSPPIVLLYHEFSGKNTAAELSQPWKGNHSQPHRVFTTNKNIIVEPKPASQQQTF